MQAFSMRCKQKLKDICAKDFLALPSIFSFKNYILNQDKECCWRVEGWAGLKVGGLVALGWGLWAVADWWEIWEGGGCWVAVRIYTTKQCRWRVTGLYKHKTCCNSSVYSNLFHLNSFWLDNDNECQVRTTADADLVRTQVMMMATLRTSSCNTQIRDGSTHRNPAQHTASS